MTQATQRRVGKWLFLGFIILSFVVVPLAPPAYSLCGRLFGGWEIVEGKLLSGEVERRATASGHYKIYYCLRVKYTYRVAGVPYRGSRVHFARTLDCNYDSEQRARQEIRVLARGGKLRVYCYSRNPSRSWLTFKTTMRGRVIMALVGAVIIVVINIADILIPTKEVGDDMETEGAKR